MSNKKLKKVKPAMCPKCGKPLVLITASLTYDADAMACRSCNMLVNRFWNKDNTYKLVVPNG